MVNSLPTFKYRTKERNLSSLLHQPFSHSPSVKFLLPSPHPFGQKGTFDFLPDLWVSPASNPAFMDLHKLELQLLGCYS